MLKKRSTDFSAKKKQCLRRVVECLFLSKAGPKSGCLSYLIAIIKKETSGMQKIALISIRYDKHPLFGPALDKNKPSTTRRKHCFFLHPLYLFCQLTFFLASCVRMIGKMGRPTKTLAFHEDNNLWKRLKVTTAPLCQL